MYICVCVCVCSFEYGFILCSFLKLFLQFCCRPCPGGDVADLICDFDELHPSSVLARPLKACDFQECLKFNKATVSRDDLKMFESFTNSFGIVGS